jgi:hypothetical protein
MSTSEQKIAALEARIGKLEAEYDTATDNDEKRQLIDAITAKENRLNRLLDAQAAAITGNAPPVTHFVSCAP